MPTNDDSTNSSSSDQLTDLQKAEMLLHIAIGKQREADAALEKAEAAYAKMKMPLPMDRFFDRGDD